MLKCLLEDAKFIICNPSAAGATTDLDGAVIDMRQDGGYDNVAFVAFTGDVAAGCVLELTARSSPNSDGSASAQDATTGTTTAGATDSDNKLIVLDVAGVNGPYVFCRLKRGTANAPINGVIAIVYRAWKKPAVQGADVIKSLFKLIK